MHTKTRVSSTLLILAVWLAPVVAHSTLAGTVRSIAYVRDTSGTVFSHVFDSNLTSAIADTGDLPTPLPGTAINLGTNAPATLPGAVARAWGSYTVSGSKVSKSTGGLGYYEDGNSAKILSWRAAAGTGLFAVTKPAGSQVSTATLRVGIRPAGLVQDPALPSTPAPDQIAVDGEYLSQGFYAENDLDVKFSIDVSIDADGVLRPLFAGAAMLGGPASQNPGLQATGDLVDVFQFSSGPGNPGHVRNFATFASQSPLVSLGAVTVDVNKPFTLNFDQLMSVGDVDPEGPEPTPIAVAMGDIFAAHGSVVVDLFVEDPQGLGLGIVAVPEPSTMLLAGLGAVALTIVGLRRRRAAR